MEELRGLSDRESIEERLNLEERRVNRSWDILFKMSDSLIETVWPGNRNARLLGNLRFIENRNDRKVICESADWAKEGGAGNLITADQADILSAKEDIIEEVERNRELNGLDIFSCDEFLRISDD
jgi:hypothetical protein